MKRWFMTGIAVQAMLGLLAAGSASVAAEALSPALAAATPQPDLALQRAGAAARDFSARLRARLQDAMATGGPVSAVGVCHEEAPAIAAAVMDEYGVQLGRVALPGRNRNPAQVAQDWRLDVLQAFQKAVQDGAVAQEQVAVIRDELPAGTALRLMRGIVTEPGCLACHGGNVSPQVKAEISRHYPRDHATGFAVGDLRGALWVEVPE